VYLKGHAGDLLKVDRRGRPPEYVERPCLTIGLAVQPEVLHGLAGRPGFGGRGLLARFLYSLPQSLVGHRQPGAPSVLQPVADRYALELQALAAALVVPAGDDGPALLALDQAAAELLLAFERELEPRLAADSGDLAHLAGWRPSWPAPPAASPASCTWPVTSPTAGPARSAPTPSPAPSS
jgi:replicative DNA helicase